MAVAGLIPEVDERPLPTTQEAEELERLVKTANDDIDEAWITPFPEEVS